MPHMLEKIKKHNDTFSNDSSNSCPESIHSGTKKLTLCSTEHGWSTQRQCSKHVSGRI